MNLDIAIAATLVIVGALYIRLRWRCSPQAYRAMIVLATCYFVAGSIAGAWILHFTKPKSIVPLTQVAAPGAAASPSTVAPMLKENYTGPSFPIPPLHYDPAHGVLPDPKLTPGDTFTGATVDDICTPGWSREHRHVTEKMRDKVYAEYGRTRGPGCCEVDHLIPLELGGSNDIKNLWPQPDDPRPGDAEKDSLENDLHARVCKGEISLDDAQKCIASNWVGCWEKYVVPEYGPEWAAANRRGW
jgi:hypothetical protein